MTPKDSNTEQKILSAAEQEFQQKGYHGARMQSIADKASINKGLLHYYFKTKDRLFEAIFEKAFDLMVQRMNKIFALEASLREKLDAFLENYLRMLMINPAIPRFVINELNRHPETFVKKMLGRKNKPDVRNIIDQIQKEIDCGNIPPIDPVHFLIDIIGMAVFPFLARPMLQGVLQLDDQCFDQIIKERKAHIMEVIEIIINPRS